MHNFFARFFLNFGVIPNSKIGTYNISIIAKALKKPFYVASESFKFMRFYPLNQRDLKQVNQSQMYQFRFCKNCSPEDPQTLQQIEVNIFHPIASLN